MPLFQSILVAADFSEISREAFRMACSLAHPDETRLNVFHAEEPPILRGELDVPIPYPSTGEGQAHREALIERLREFYAPNQPLQIEYRTRDGFAAEEILLASDEVGADLIVLGTHGRTGLRRLLAGSVAEVVVRRARCPVLALRSPAHLAPLRDTRDVTRRSPDETPGTEAPETQEPATSPTRTILYPTDFSDRSAIAFRVSCSLAEEQGARLIVLHAAPMATVYGGTFPGVPTDPGIYQHAFEERLRQIRLPGPGPEAAAEERLPGAGTARPEILVEHRLREGDAAAEILQVADEVGADLIVMGTHGRTGLARMLMGSVAEDVLRRANCPVLMLKSPLSETESVSNEPSPRPVILP